MNRKTIHLAVIVWACILSVSICQALENQIINGEFDNGIEPWQKSDGDGFTIGVVQDAGLSGTNALKINVLDANAQESIMVSQGIFVLERGATYHIGFTAKADADRQMGVLFEENGTWADTWYEWIDLTPSSQTFTFDFINGHSSTDTIVFYFILKHPWFPLHNEDENIDVYIDDVYVIQEPPADPNLAHYPWPPDGAVHEDLWAVLSWSTGRHAVSHDVYFGENHDDVYNGTENTFGGNQDICFWIIGIGFDYPRPLVPGTTYYWRIDEVNDLHPDSPWRGDVWSFWLPPYTAYDPVPADGAELIDPNVTLSWKSSSYANTYNVYFGENATDVEDGTGDTFKGSFSETSYTPNCLDFNTTYYWRVDVFYSWGTYEQGEVWSFSTKPAEPNIAHNPNPPNGAIHPDTWVTLSWSPGRHAVSHDFYFGYNFQDVNNGTGETYCWNQTSLYVVAGFPDFPWEGLIPGTTYYWRIDEVNDLHPDSPWKGDVWSFGIPPYTAYDPSPADGAKQIDPNVILSWEAGLHAELHVIYFGESYEDVNDATAGLPQEATTYTPGPLEFDKTYYWRVDEYGRHTKHKGQVWNFTTVSAALDRDENRSGSGVNNRTVLCPV